MAQSKHISYFHYLFDVSSSMNNTNGVMRPLCKFVPGRTHGEHAVEICKACERLLSNYIHHHHYRISFQGNPDEYSEHLLTLEAIEMKYQNQSRPRYKSNIIQRLHNILRMMKNDAYEHPNSFSRLLIFSDGEDNKSTKALKQFYRQTMAELRSLGISIIVINFGTTGLDVFDAVHYISDDFPPGNMDQQAKNMLLSDIPQSTHNDSRTNSSSYI